jgi:hypothetical protein
MRRAFVLLACAVAVASGCGGEDDKDDDAKARNTLSAENDAAFSCGYTVITESSDCIYEFDTDTQSFPDSAIELLERGSEGAESETEVPALGMSVDHALGEVVADMESSSLDLEADAAEEVKALRAEIRSASASETTWTAGTSAVKRAP